MIQVGFSTTNMFLSKIIRDVTKAKISHCWFVFDMYGKQFVLQADIGGVKIAPYNKASKKWTNIQTVPLKHEIDMAPAWDMLDTDYDYGGLIGNAWVYLGARLGKKWKNPTADSHALFCSEFVIDVLQAVKYPGAEKYDPETTTPEQILELLTA